MKRHRPNPQRVKIHRSYEVADIAELFGIHRNTVRQWIKQGLPVTDTRRPQLITGHALREYLQSKRQKHKRPCQPGELYCLRCRTPQKPACDMADFHAVTEKVGKLTAICPVCDSLMHQRISMATFEKIRTTLNITITQAPQRIGDSNQPIVNSDLKEVMKP